jgi:hypothetical protein
MTIIVSGLPRSGTSLMMQCLQAGGLPVHIGATCRPPDIDNPKGYFEPSNAREIVALDLRKLNLTAVKILFPWITGYDEKEQGKAIILWMQRDEQEMAASQRDMCLHRNLDVHYQKAMVQACREHLERWYKWRDRQRELGVHIMHVSHRDLIVNPLQTCADVASYLNKWAGISLLPEMHKAVEPLLYRQRKEWIKP